MELLDKIPFLFESLNAINTSSAGQRKLQVKLVQSIALVLLPPKVASWRYQRGY
jgi:hypothetical protein